MEAEGKIIKVMPIQQGTTERGSWMSQEYVLEVPGMYPKKMVFSVFGADRIKRLDIKEGLDYRIWFEIDAHEHQGRFYNTIRAWDARQTAPAAQPAPAEPTADDISKAL